MDEHVLAAVIANDEAEALLRIEEFDDALAFADDLRGHPATGAAASAAEAAAAAATEATASAAAIAAGTTAEAAAVTVTAAATAAAIASTSAAAVAAALLETAAEITCETFFAAETFALVATATPALAFAPSIETHNRPYFLARLSKTNALGPNGATGHARNPLTHRSGHYSKNEPRSSDSNRWLIRRGWHGRRLGD